MKNSLLLAAVMISANAIAQLEGMDGAANFSGADSHMFRSFDNRYEGIRGHSTLFDDFVEGTVELKNGAIGKNLNINLDIVTGELLLKSKTMNKIMVLQTGKVKSFFISDFAGKREFLNVEGLGYVEPIYNGKNKLYYKHRKYIEKANYGGAYNSNGRRYDEFVENSFYVLVREGAKPEEIKLSRKSIEKAYPEKSAEIKKYFKEKSPDLKDAASLKALFGFLDA